MDTADTTNYKDILIFTRLHYSLGREYKQIVTLHIFYGSTDILILKSEMRTTS